MASFSHELILVLFVKYQPIFPDLISKNPKTLSNGLKTFPVELLFNLDDLHEE